MFERTKLGQKVSLGKLENGINLEDSKYYENYHFIQINNN